MIKIGKSASSISVYTCQPKTRDELDTIIEEKLKKEGIKCDLNDIDVSKITDMSWLFYKIEFNGDISKWDVSNVKNMSGMFEESVFNGDISKWDVSNVKNMVYMFMDSIFNQDVSGWNIDEDCYINFMFDNCPIEEEYKPKSLQ